MPRQFAGGNVSHHETDMRRALMETGPARVAEGEAVDDLEAATDEAIARHGGDPREAVRALLAANLECERALAMTMPVVSYGFSRGWHHRGGT